MSYQGRYKLSLHEEKAAITTHFLRHYPCCLLLNAKTESNICPPRLHCKARVLVGHSVEERDSEGKGILYIQFTHYSHAVQRDVSQL